MLIGNAVLSVPYEVCHKSQVTVSGEGVIPLPCLIIFYAAGLVATRIISV